MRGVEMISERPALPISLVVTWQVAEPAVAPVFVMVIATASPPGTESAGLIATVKGPIPRDALPASEARRSTAAPMPISLDDRMRQLEAELIAWALRASKGNKSKAARLLQIKRSTLGDRIQRCGLEHSADAAAAPS